MYRETMEQSLVSSSDEIEVAGILLELPNLIFQSESRPRFPFTWGAKRKRSASWKLAAVSSPTPEPSPSPAPPLVPCNGVAASTSASEGPTEKALTSSPATPLLFSPSESDDNPPQPPKKKAAVNRLERKKEQLLEMEVDYSRRNELLKKEIEETKRLMQEKEAQNLMLKAKKQIMLSQSLGKVEEPRLETGKSLNLYSDYNQDRNRHLHLQQRRIPTEVYQRVPFIVDRTVSTSHHHQYPYGRPISWLQSNNGGMSKLHDNVGPLGHIDLNVSLEEAYPFTTSKPFDLNTTTAAAATTSSKAKAAEARFKRKQICRSKSYNASCKARYPFR